MDSRYLVKRLGMSVLVLLVAISIAYAAFRLLPGGPVEAMRERLIDRMRESGQTVSMEQVDQMIRVTTGVDPDAPLYVSYYEYVRDIVLYQDFGRSIYKNKPVYPYLLKRVPWSVFLSVYGLAAGRTTSLLLGAGMAYKEGSRVDSGLTIFTILNRGVPYYFVAVIFLVVFGFVLEWFPTSGRMNAATTPGLNYPFLAGIVSHAFLPIVAGFVAGFGGALAYRGNCVREMGKSYIKIARLRGLSSGRIAIRYVGRNAILPIYTGIVMGIATIFGSSIIIETIFTYPAVGYATFGALVNRDYPLLMAAFIFFTFMTVVGVLIADLTYGIIDPRVKSGGERESY